MYVRVCACIAYNLQVPYTKYHFINFTIARRQYCVIRIQVQCICVTLNQYSHVDLTLTQHDVSYNLSNNTTPEIDTCTCNGLLVVPLCVVDIHEV